MKIAIKKIIEKCMLKKDNNTDVEIVRENYNKNAQLEWERLEGFHFEFEITKHYLKKYLRGKTVLDIGGGPGAAVPVDIAYGLHSRDMT